MTVIALDQRRKINPQRVRKLTPCQDRAMRHLVQFNKLTIAQAARAARLTAPNAARGLNQLAGDGLALYGMCGPVRVYQLTKTGAALAVDKGFADKTPRYGYGDCDGFIIFGDIRHELRQVDVMLSIIHAVRRRPRYQLLDITADFFTNKKGGKRVRATSDDVKDGRRIVPDVVATVMDLDRQKSLALLIECENYEITIRSLNERERSVQQKLRRYAMFTKQESSRIIRADSFRVLYVVNKKERVEAITAGNVLPWQDWGEFPDFCRFSTYAETHDDFLGKCWTLFDGEKGRLVEAEAE